MPTHAGVQARTGYTGSQEPPCTMKKDWLVDWHWNYIDIGVRRR